MNTSERYMNAYERAHARAYMEQAMALADWGVRISERIGAAIERSRRSGSGATAAELVDAARIDLDEFRGEQAPRDDVVILAVRFEGS